MKKDFRYGQYCSTRRAKIVVIECNACGHENDVTMELHEKEVETVCRGAVCTCTIYAVDHEMDAPLSPTSLDLSFTVLEAQQLAQAANSIILAESDYPAYEDPEWRHLKSGSQKIDDAIQGARAHIEDVERDRRSAARMKGGAE